MITQYFDINNRLIIQTPGSLAPAGATTWVYGDNYNLAIYLVAAGVFQTIQINDSLELLLFQPGGTLPEQNLAIIASPIIQTDPAGYTYYFVNTNLKTTPLANLVQTPNKSAQCQFHYTFLPGDGERFSSQADLAVTVNPDPTEGATGATPVPPGYPTNPNVFEMVSNKGLPSGYAPLDSTGKVPSLNLPAATAGGDMLKSVYDTNNDGIVDHAALADATPWSGITAKPAAFPPDSTGELVVHKDQPSGYPGLDANTHLNPNEIPIDTTLHVVGGLLGAVSGGSGDMLASVYDPTHSGTVLKAGQADYLQLINRPSTFPPGTHGSTHNGGADPIALASATGQGLCPQVDGTTVQITGSPSKLSAILASASAPGIVQPDNVTVKIAGNLISVPTATAAALGLVKPDGTTIAISGGTISMVGSPGIGQHGCRYRNSATINYPTAGAVQPITFDTSIFDTDVYSASANPIGTTGRITIPAGQAGYYAIGGCVLFAITTGQTNALLAIQLNGSANTYLVVNQKMFIATPPNPYILPIETVVHLNAGDFIQLVIQTNVTASLTSAYSNLPNFYAMRIS